MAYVLGTRSQQKLYGVHLDLQRVVVRALGISEIDFTVTEGVRTLARQKKLMAAGATRTLNSRHITGHAVDLAAMIGSTVRWDWPLYTKLAIAMKTAAKDLGVPIEWGGDWKSFKDGPHFQLPFSKYPK